MMAEHKHLVEEGAQLVELRLDYVRGPINFKRILKDRPCPIIATCRRECDGGRFTGTEEERQMILRTAIVEGVDYIDLEEDIAGSIPRFGKTKRLISYHNFRKTPDDVEAIYAKMTELDPDVIKVCTMANHPQDNLRVLKLIKAGKIPTIGICMGDMGMPSRILAGKFGAPFTYATFHQERTLSPGQLSFNEMVNLYHYDQINEATEVFGVIADPIGHSLSPLIHNRAFVERKMNRVYLPFRVPRDQVGSFFDEAAELDIRGLSVTIPHKETVLSLLDEADDLVKGIGACNTVVFKDGKRVGYNTDCSAAITSIETVLGQGAKLDGKTALIMGAGGVGRAMAYGLLKRGATVVVSDGKDDVAKRLASDLKCKMVLWKERHDVPADILINGTPVGMHPNVDQTPFDKKKLRRGMVIFDAVYNPESTLFIKNAREKGCNVVTGVEMFVRQAAHQFKLFTGEDAPEELMRETIRRSISAVKY